VADGSANGPGPDDADVLLSLPAVAPAARASMQKAGRMWIDLEHKERSDPGNDLGEEVTQYLKRYGVRLIRVR
jgi:hypothetical protein